MLDTRGQGEDSGLVAAASASRHQYVVLLVRGRDEALVADAKKAMLSMIDIGYEKIGLILSDDTVKSGRAANGMLILSGGKAAMDVPRMDTGERTQAMIVRLVRHVYDNELGVPARVKELDQELARLKAERDALAQRRDAIARERQDIAGQQARLREEQVLLQRFLDSVRAPTVLARAEDGRLSNAALEAVVAAHEARTGQRVDRNNRGQVMLALQSRLAQIEDAQAALVR